MEKTAYKVTGMTCDGCARVVKTLLSKIEGVSNVGIDLASGAATVEADKEISTDALNAALKNTSYRVEGKQ